MYTKKPLSFMINELDSGYVISFLSWHLHILPMIIPGIFIIVVGFICTNVGIQKHILNTVRIMEPILIAMFNKRNNCIIMLAIFI